MAFVLPQLLFLILLLLSFSAISQTNDGKISVGSTLTAGAESAFWLSHSNDFAFGFRKLDDNHYLLAIWYYKIPQKTIVWYANGDNPGPRQSRVELTNNSLILRQPQGDQELWRAEFQTATTIAYGLMNDTGNFMLVDTSSRTNWESFKHPTDTLLPTQEMEIGGSLFSRQRETNFSRGRYEFLLREDGSAVLNPKNVLSNITYKPYYYYISETRGLGNGTNSGYKLIFDQSGYLYILLRNGKRSFITTLQLALSPARNYVRATLGFDGVFSISYFPKNFSAANGTWSVIQAEPDNICLKVGPRPCGDNSICTLKEGQRPSCKCPKGYSLLDPADEYSSCKPDFMQGCDQDGDLYYLNELPNTNWPNSDYDVLRQYNATACQRSCLEDCRCAAVVLSGSNCWKKHLPLLHGRENTGYSDSAFVKLRSIPQSPIPQVPRAKKHKSSFVVVSVLLGSSVFVNFILVGAMCLGFFLYYQKKLKAFGADKTCVDSNLRYFTYKELMEATEGFKEELGRGSCGIVYKGKTAAQPIAVKILDRVLTDKEKEFRAEVQVIGQTHHKNLVRLVGYCDEGQYRLLVYEFLSNGSLAGFLFGDLKPSWSQRSQIALGVARGLFYLHEECSTRIIHCYIKPQNILLDENYNARISDFGLAKLLLNQTQTKTGIRGTKGYVAPDWFRPAPVSVKVDVYSFGVLLLEIICCRRNVYMEHGVGEKGVLTDWAYDCYCASRLDALIQNEMEAMNDMNRVERFVMVAIWCVQEDPSVRPRMKNVMLMLEGLVQVSVPPSPYPLSSIS
ncbi:putative protein kinase RLK-Pelle-SD-2b family [Rosa chinensis]|uniref:Receptor-like serine/threonine-protein kinase n=1 Tax=Rosa chinensis TaxID=74649 RepID=A0A2P6QM80_ROSCH|nr:G-type lectin S-receptor-like serine/threonine-protein kinase RLK1 [Rosa chinensis]PRQ35291.1 putative protein kinase RLK-Pelle-SD-2b family [Rosa chinensis]